MSAPPCNGHPRPGATFSTEELIECNPDYKPRPTSPTFPPLPTIPESTTTTTTTTTPPTTVDYVIVGPTAPFVQLDAPSTTTATIALGTPPVSTSALPQTGVTSWIAPLAALCLVAGAITRHTARRTHAR